MAKAVFELVSNQINEPDFLSTLKKLLARIKGVQLPYLRKSLDYNIDTISKSETTIAAITEVNFAGPDCVSIYLPVKHQRSEKLIVNPSIHLRY